MALKLKLDIDYSEDYRIIGISSHLKDFRLAFFLNKSLKLDLRKINDFTFQSSVNKPILNYSFYFYQTTEAWYLYSMIGNFNAYGRLIPTLWQYDFFLFINGPIEDEEIAASVNLISKVHSVLIAKEITFTQFKNGNYLIADLEMHLNANKLIN